MPPKFKRLRPFSKRSPTSYRISGVTRENGETAKKCSKGRDLLSGRDSGRVGPLLGCNPGEVPLDVRMECLYQ